MERWERGRVFIASKTNFHSSKVPNHALWQKIYEAIILWKQTLWLNLVHSCLMRNYWLFCWPSPKICWIMLNFRHGTFYLDWIWKQVQWIFLNSPRVTILFVVFYGKLVFIMFFPARFLTKLTRWHDIIIASSAFYVSLQISPNIIIVYRVGHSQRFDIYTIIIYIIYINAGDSRPSKPLG